MEDSSNSEAEDVFQYYTVINDPAQQNEQEQDDNNQIVCLPIDDVYDASDNAESASNQLEACENSRESDSLALLDSNVHVILLEDGTMFMRTNPEGKQICDSNQENIQNNELKTSEVVNSDMNRFLDGQYEIIRVVDNSASPEEMLEMVSCDSSTQPRQKKEKLYICPYESCGQTYTVVLQLQNHMRSHFSSKVYACTEEGCDKSFSKNYSLKCHLRTHTGEKPYVCSVCQKAFKTSGDLQKHVRIHTGEKPFMCPHKKCGKSFTTSNIRRIHIRSHTGERPFTCNYPNCGKAFSSTTNYKNHLRIHSGEKPYVCQVKECGKRFTEYSSLYKHTLVHKTERPYICHLCNQTFKQQSSMTLHKRVKHNIVIASDGTEIVVDVY